MRPRRPGQAQSAGSGPVPKCSHFDEAATKAGGVLGTPHSQLTPDVDGGCLPLLTTKVHGIGSDSRGSEGPW